jgi:CPA1 family monovalent cation:H+ antiporter
VNDATGLIAYRYAVAAVVTGAFSIWEASGTFIIVAVGGIALGLAMGRLFKWLHQITPDNPTMDTALTFLTPFVVYMVAESLHISGVLAVVTCGLLISWNSSQLFNHQTRLQAYGSWNTAIFILNGIVFILIGLQLPMILEGIGDHSFMDLLKYGVIISFAVIIGRIIWVYPAAYIPRLSRKIREAEPEVNVKLVTIVAWSGMRGVVSLAAAMAIPLFAVGSTPFPNRNLIIFLTFSVIFATLVVQGLTLRPLIKWVGIKADGKEREEELKVRYAIASALIEHIEEHYSMSLTDEGLNLIKTKYEIRSQRISKDQARQRMNEQQIDQLHTIQQALLDKEREMIIRLRNQGAISEEALHKIEYELDLEESRLILEKGIAS